MNKNINEEVKRNFLVNRDETGKEIIYFPKTGKKYYIEYIGNGHSNWGDIDPVTKKLTGNYGTKFRGSVTPQESVITEENGFENIVEGKGSAYANVERLHNKWKKENGYS